MPIFHQSWEGAKNRPRVHINENFAAEKLGRLLTASLDNLLPDPAKAEIVLLCIGTDRSTGDCLGPLVGTKLSENPLNQFKIVGTLDEPLHAANLVTGLEALHENGANPFMIAIDACLGRLESVGYINLGKGALRPGAGVNKNLPPVGELHITGIVNVGGFMEYFVLQNTRLSVVMQMANIIAKGIVYTGQAVKTGKSRHIKTPNQL